MPVRGRARRRPGSRRPAATKPATERFGTLRLQTGLRGAHDTSWYDRPDVGQLIAKGNADGDPVQRRQDYCQAEKTIWDDAPLIFLHTQKLPVVTTKKVSDVVTLPNEQFTTVYATPAST